MRIAKEEKHLTTGLPASEELRFKRSQSSHVIWATTLFPNPPSKPLLVGYFEFHCHHFPHSLVFPQAIPSPTKELKQTVRSHLQLWSSWLWESRWSWPSSPVLKSSGAGQRSTGIFSASHRSPLCIPEAPQSWAWWLGDGRTVPEASEMNQPREKQSR